MSSDPNIPIDPTPPEDRYLWEATGPVDVEVAALEQAGASVGSTSHWSRVLARRARRRTIVMSALACAVVVIAASSFLGFQAWERANQPWRGMVAKVVGEANLRRDVDEHGLPTLEARTINRQAVELSLLDGGTIVLRERGAVDIAGYPGKSPQHIRVIRGEVRAFSGAAAVSLALGDKNSIELASNSAVSIVGAGFEGLSNGNVAAIAGWAQVRWQGVAMRLLPGDNCDLPAQGAMRVAVRAGSSDELAKAVAFVDDLRLKSALDSGKWKVDPVERVTSLAAEGDASTLWNLLQVVDAGHREMVAGRLLALIGRKDEKLFEGAISRDPEVLDDLWKSIVDLDLGSKRDGK